MCWHTAFKLGLMRLFLSEFHSYLDGAIECKPQNVHAISIRPKRPRIIHQNIALSVKLDLISLLAAT